MTSEERAESTAEAFVNAARAALGAPTPKPTALSPGQVEASLIVWATRADGVETGIWEASPGSFTAHRDGYHEFCHVVSGTATIESDDGVRTELAAGDVFVTPAGWRGVWHVHETLRKSFVVVDVR